MARTFSPFELLTILIQRTEKRANVLEYTRIEAYKDSIYELRNVARHLRSAGDYLHKLQAEKQ